MRARCRAAAVCSVVWCEEMWEGGVAFPPGGWTPAAPCTAAGLRAGTVRCAGQQCRQTASISAIRQHLSNSRLSTRPPAAASSPIPQAGVGSPFDPNMHDGIMRELNNDVPDGTVLEEFRKVGGLRGRQGWRRVLHLMCTAWCVCMGGWCGRCPGLLQSRSRAHHFSCNQPNPRRVSSSVTSCCGPPWSRCRTRTSPRHQQQQPRRARQRHQMTQRRAAATDLAADAPVWCGLDTGAAPLPPLSPTHPTFP